MTAVRVEQIDGEPDVTAEADSVHLGLATLAALVQPAAKIDTAISNLAVPMATADVAAASDQLAAWLDGQIPLEVLKGSPSNLSAIDLVQWKIKAAISAHARLAVPVTDTLRPALNLAAVDLTTLPAHARMAHGYSAARKG